MSLALTFLVVAFALAAFILALSTFLQGYLYQQPADKLILRSAVAAMSLAVYLSFWTSVNSKAEGDNRYGTFFEFNPTSTRTLTNFEAVRRYPRNADEPEKVIAYQWNGQWIEAAERKPYKPNDSNYITVAVLVPEPSGQKTRFDASGTASPRNFIYSEERKYKETNGSRYIDIDQPGVVYSPSSGVVFAALLLNLLLFVVWFAVCWPVLRFGMFTSMLLSAILGLICIVVLMPLLFRVNKPRPPALPPAATTRQMMHTDYLIASTTSSGDAVL